MPEYHAGHHASGQLGFSLQVAPKLHCPHPKRKEWYGLVVGFALQKTSWSQIVGMNSKLKKPKRMQANRSDSRKPFINSLSLENFDESPIEPKDSIGGEVLQTSELLLLEDG